MAKARQTGCFLPQKALLILLLLARSVGLAQNVAAPQYSCRLWQTDDGLPHNAVQAIAQSSIGYLWIGTSGGLVRFDGVRFTSDAVPELRGMVISSLCASDDGGVWIGTAENGLFQIVDGPGVRGLVSVELPQKAIRCLFCGSDGALWIGTTGGLIRLKEGKVLCFSSTNGLASSVIRAIALDRAGDILAATAGGLNRIRAQTQNIDKIEHSCLANKTLRAVCLDTSGDMWVGTLGGVARIYGDEAQFFGKTDGLADDMISSLFVDASGTIWVGTQGGLNSIDKSGAICGVDNESASENSINCIFEDSERNLWVGTKEGLIQLRRNPVTTFTKRHGLTHNNVTSIMEDRNGFYWIGTWGGGIDVLRKSWDKILPYKQFSLNLVLALHEDRDGMRWIGTDYGGGLFCLKGSRFTHYGVESGLGESAIRVVLEDSKRRLWVGTSGGLYLRDEGRFKRYGTDVGMAGDVVRALAEDIGGGLWVGTSGGLSLLEDGKFTNFSRKDGVSGERVTALFRDREGDLWIGADSGLCRRSNGKFAAFTTKDGLWSDDILEIIEDNGGRLWMACGRGIFWVEKQALVNFRAGGTNRLSCRVYGRGDGMASSACSNVAKPGVWKARDGRLWFATAKGLAVINPIEASKINERPPVVVIEEVVADKQAVGPGAPGKGGGGVFMLDIPPGNGDVEFRFTALSFTEPERVRFKYMLDGLDSGWTESGTRRAASYKNVPPGQYRFRVIAGNSDGVWSGKGAELRISLRPHVWRTWWFIALAIAASAAAVSVGARAFFLRRLRRKLAWMEQQNIVEKERARIARDMHDDLGTRLTEILMTGYRAQSCAEGSGDGKRHLDRITVAARESIDNLDAIVWAVNPRNDTLDKLILYISEFAGPFLDASSIRFRLAAPNPLPDFALSSETRHNVFLAVKEALNNVAKHSGASEVWVRLELGHSKALICVEDNGKGIGKIDSGGSGNGLRNMRKRMKSIGGEFETSNAPGGGLRICLTFPISPS